MEKKYLTALLYPETRYAQYIDIRPGWYPVVNAVAEFLHEHNKEFDPQLELVFAKVGGTMHVYYGDHCLDNENERISKICRGANYLCELCGNQARPVRWVARCPTLCPGCTYDVLRKRPDLHVERVKNRVVREFAASINRKQAAYINTKHFFVPTATWETFKYFMREINVEHSHYLRAFTPDPLLHIEILTEAHYPMDNYAQIMLNRMSRALSDYCFVCKSVMCQKHRM
ncbi:MAG: hypothetical protein CMN85_09170 [Spongiibacteraceae bacterium]|nr:hypothetical protein [Spongiibacteraceae bacterium]|tara:strand:- start:3980 stop:4666 length:687 start_codon:yes stop_codon:yes gene_type:complete